RDQGKRPNDQRVERLHGPSPGPERSARDARAKHQTSTARAPARTRARAQARAVAPEVATAPTRRTRRDGAPSTRKARHTFAARRDRGTRLWTSVSRIFTRRPRANGILERRAISSARTSAGW